MLYPSVGYTNMYSSTLQIGLITNALLTHSASGNPQSIGEVRIAVVDRRPVEE